MQQLELFRQDPGATPAAAASQSPDDDTVNLLLVFKHHRLAEGASPRSVAREVGQIRALLRDDRTLEQGTTLRMLVGDLDLVARLLREPLNTISRSTCRDRLRAVQRFIRIVGPTLGRDPSADLAALGTLLPTRRPTGWHATGVLVAGTPGRRRRRGPTLDATDLRRIVDAAGAATRSHPIRDRALVALHCFSGLRPEEIVRLCWEDLETELTADGRYGLTAALVRGAQMTRLLLPGLASDAVEALAVATGGTVESLAGPVLRARDRPGRPLSYRAARDVLQAACRRAGLPPVESISLWAACAHWLRSQGLSDHEVAAVLGLARVRSVDRLLERHRALDAQRTVREMMSR